MTTVASNEMLKRRKNGRVNLWLASTQFRAFDVALCWHPLLVFVCYTIDMKDFRKYLIEILVIVIGITISFLVNEWREERKERQEEKEILTDIKYGLEKDKINIERCRTRFDIQMKSIDSVFVFLEKPKMDDRLQDLIPRSLFTTTFQPHTGAYDDLKGRGISIIQNDSLRDIIVTMFERISPTPKLQEDFFINELRKGIMNYCLRNFDKYGVYKSDDNNWFTHDRMIPNNYDKLRNDAEFKSLLKTYHSFLDMQITGCSIVYDNIHITLTLIDKDLSK